MKFGYTILYVPDVTRAVEFYEQAFGLQRRFIGDTYGEMDTGATILSFASNDQARSNLPYDFQRNSPTEPPAGFEIAFITENVSATYQQAVAAGATPVAAPKDKPWGQTVAYVRDPDGVLVEICTEIASG